MLFRSNHVCYASPGGLRFPIHGLVHPTVTRFHPRVRSHPKKHTIRVTGGSAPSHPRMRADREDPHPRVRAVLRPSAVKEDVDLSVKEPPSGNPRLASRGRIEALVDRGAKSPPVEAPHGWICRRWSPPQEAHLCEVDDGAGGDCC